MADKCPLCGCPVRIIRREDGSADHREALTLEELDTIPVPISPVLDQFLRAQREGKRTVAIVGAGWTSRSWAPYQEPGVEVWCFNEMHGRTGTGKATRWFQLHPRWDFEKNHPRHHREWLTQEHDFPIYMQQEYDGIPNAVRYPLAEVQNKLLGNIWKGEGEIRKLFGSSVAYAIALALYEARFDRIELFGIELVLEGEWAYQRESMAYWLGKADGMGVEIWMPEACELFRMPLYGFEETRKGDGSILVPPENAE